MAKIHSMAVVDPKAVIADNVEIGPHCIVGPNVKIGAGCKLIGQCNVVGYTEIGENNTIYPFASLGTEPHDLSFQNWVSYLKVGNGNVFREGFTANRGAAEGTTTLVGDNCYFMANSHIGHNAQVGNRVVLANGALLAGHTVLEDGCFIGGGSALHQFVRVGRFVIMGGVSASSVDIPPFVVADGRNKPIRNINLIGLRRNGFSREAISAIKQLFKIFFKSELSVPSAIQKIKEEVPMLPEVEEFIDFVEKRGKRGIATGKTGDR